MATIKHDHIVEECWHVLENAGSHSNTGQRRFLIGYQIYKILEEEGNLLCQELIRACKGDYRGKGAHHDDDGGYDGQVKRIAQALSRNPNIETRYVCTRYLRIGDIIPSCSEDCAIFRIRN